MTISCRGTVVVFMVLAAGLGEVLSGAACGDEVARPNILFILTDDQRWDAVGYAGNSAIKTPNLDRLAAQGARFDAFYAANPVCNPSRTTYLTGRYIHEGPMNQQNPFRPFINKGVPTVATHLNKAGYATGFIGKAHLDGDPGRWDFREVPVRLPKAEGGSVHWNPLLVVDGQEKTVAGHVTRIFADAAIAFMNRHAKDRWFLWLATTAPHTPYQHFDAYPFKGRPIPPPPGWPPSQKFQVVPRLAEWDAYYSTVCMLDEQVGRVLKALEDQGQADKTVVIFASDNGIMHLSHGHLWKSIWFEESSRVPAAVRWPGRVKPGQRITSPAVSVDLLPTVLEIAGVAPPGDLKGLSLIPAITGGKPVRQSAFSEGRRLKNLGGGDWQMVRHGDWKYVEFTNLPERHLYDLKNDPHEQEDLYAMEKHAGVRADMERRLAEWREPR